MRVHYFNPRSREGSDHGSSNRTHNQRYISIHAPAKGATTPVAACLQAPAISIHAPAKGATQIGLYPIKNRIISIHAPAKGATGSRPTASIVTVEFQSTLPRRERPQRRRCKGVSSYFNPRSREGSDEMWCRFRTLTAVFQSTLPRRERHPPTIKPYLPSVLISIHAPAKGATVEDEYINFRLGISIHAPAKGATSR